MTQRQEQPPGLRRVFEIKNRLGLHARAAALFVQAVKDLDAAIVVSKDGQDVDGKSIIGLMMLAAAQGSEIEVTAAGPAAATVLEAIAALIDARFNEQD